MIDHLPVLIPPAPRRPVVAGPDHPMRKVTRQVAFEPDGWTPERAAKVADLFDGLAAGWDERDGITQLDPLTDALARGGLSAEPVAAGRCLEIGSGTGQATSYLRPRFDTVIALDLSLQMLLRAPAASGARVLGDAASLPLPDHSVQAVVLVNALLFAHEVDRVLAPGGRVVWVSSLGDATPIYLPVDDVVTALPGAWDAVASTAGWGTWAVVTRAAS